MNLSKEAWLLLLVGQRRRLGGTRPLARALGVSKASVQRWVSGSFVTIPKATFDRIGGLLLQMARQFGTTPAPLPPGGRRQDTRARLWQSLRVMRRVTFPDLMVTAGAGEGQVKTFLWQLQRGGYVRLDQGLRGRVGRRGVYCLVLNTGPKPPSRIQGRRALFDRNLGKIMEVPGDE